MVFSIYTLIKRNGFVNDLSILFIYVALTMRYHHLSRINITNTDFNTVLVFFDNFSENITYIS